MEKAETADVPSKASALPWKENAKFAVVGLGTTGEILSVASTGDKPDAALKAVPAVASPRVLESDLHRVVAKGRRCFLQLLHGFVDSRLMPQKAKNFIDAARVTAEKFQTRFKILQEDAKKAVDDIANLNVDITVPGSQRGEDAIDSWIKKFSIDSKIRARFNVESWDYMLMELVPGGTMRHCFGKAADFVDLLQVLAQALAALGTALDDIGLIHNDFHPANVLIEEHKAEDVTVTLGKHRFTLPQAKFAPIISDFGYSFLIQNERNKESFSEEYWRVCGDAKLASAMETLVDMRNIVEAPARHDVQTMGKTMDGTIGKQALLEAILSDLKTKELVDILKNAASAEAALLTIANTWPDAVKKEE